MERINGKSGLTLIEIIISVAILGIVAMLFLSIFANNFKHVQNAGDDSQGLISSQAVIEGKMREELAGKAYSLDVFDGLTATVDGVLVSDGTFVTFLPGLKEIPEDASSNANIDTMTFDGKVPVPVGPVADRIYKVDKFGNKEPVVIIITPEDNNVLKNTYKVESFSIPDYYLVTITILAENGVNSTVTKVFLYKN